MEYVDRILKCADCAQDFVFTAGEQLFFNDKQFKNDPKRCKSCKAKRAARPSGASPSTMRTGAQYLRSLDDGRQIFLDGERIGKVVEHPAFREAARNMAKLFDIAAAPDMSERMTFPSPKTGAPVWRGY